MTEYDNTNKGTIVKNKRKKTSSHPEYSGSVNVDGKEFWLSAWVKTNGSTGEKFFSLALQPKDDQGEGSQDTLPMSNDEDDVPF